MRRKKVQISFNLDSDLNQQVIQMMKDPPCPTKSDVLNQLIADGLQAKKTIDRSTHREDYLLLKILFMLREIARSRGDDFIDQLDQRFEDEKDFLKEMIISQGMDYVGNGRSEGP